MAGSQNRPELIILVGMPGSGKSTLGPLLANVLNWRFVDLDDNLMTKTGKSVADIFHEHGEQFFRELERESLLKLLEEKNLVISCGGGTPAYADNMDLMLLAGTVIYLDTDVTNLASRLKSEHQTRPLLRGKALLPALNLMLRDRLPHYRKAQLHIDTNNKLPENLITEILNRCTYFDS